MKNEIRKLRDMMFDVESLAKSDKPEPSKYGPMPTTFFDKKKQNDAESEQQT